jgi:hypothetical protein
MEDAKPGLKVYTTKVIPKFIEHWDINMTMDPQADVKKMPVFSRMIDAANNTIQTEIV